MSAPDRRLGNEARALARIAASVALGDPLDSILASLARSIVETTIIRACGIIVVEEGSSWAWRRAASYGLPEGYTEAALRSYDNDAPLLTSQVFRTGRPVVLEDGRGYVLNDPRFAPMHPFERDAPWKALACYPLVSRGRTVGSIYTMYPEETPPTPDDLEFLQAVADQTVIAVENARLFDELKRLAALEERQRLARELHDSVSQALYGIAMGAQSARMAAPGGVPALTESLEYVLALAEGALSEMRALIFELRPEALAEEGLVAALAKHAAATRARHELRVEVDLSDEPPLPFEAREALYRIAQEAMHNTVKHARATTVRVRLGRAADGTVELEVRDDGCGFDAERAYPGHLGQTSMRERAERAGATLTVDSGPGRGTRVLVRVPASAEPAG